MSFYETLPYVAIEPAHAPGRQDSALSARITVTDAEIEAAIERALDECEYESFVFVDEVVYSPQVDVRFGEGSNPSIRLGFDETAEAFFAEGDALSEQHRAEAEALAERKAFGTMMMPWWRRLLSRSGRPDFA